MSGNELMRGNKVFSEKGKEHLNRVMQRRLKKVFELTILEKGDRANVARRLVCYILKA
jgi:hypothetical protein